MAGREESSARLTTDDIVGDGEIEPHEFQLECQTCGAVYADTDRRETDCFTAGHELVLAEYGIEYDVICALPVGPETPAKPRATGALYPNVPGLRSVETNG